MSLWKHNRSGWSFARFLHYKVHNGMALEFTLGQTAGVVGQV